MSSTPAKCVYSDRASAAPAPAHKQDNYYNKTPVTSQPPVAAVAHISRKAYSNVELDTRAGRACIATGRPASSAGARARRPSAVAVPTCFRQGILLQQPHAAAMALLSTGPRSIRDIVIFKKFSLRVAAPLDTYLTITNSTAILQRHVYT
ncbi:hypothetical protein EVAR_64888_1 [Eumeta japonica]|uniref:Uncharacterized protein n=1 Tax=Eumeta variegata TaxID=151549 RepID=A0A4C1ZXQ7_EUMVA|nr:hypothetical protein EVAR_64888_1 [Eumeta japonica]